MNVIGEHVDYLGGPVLPFACDRDVLLAARPADDVVLESFEEPGVARVPLAGEPGKLEGWARYPGGVLRALREAGMLAWGLRGVLTSAVPVGAGLSSSAALEAAIALALTRGERPPAEVLRRAEHLATGVPCGVMDQVAVLHGREGGALLLDCGTGAWEEVRLPEGLGFVVVDSGTRRRLEDGRYAQRQAEAQEAWGVAARELGVEALDELDPTDLGRVEAAVGEVGSRRLRHVVGEAHRVREAVATLRRGDLEALGALVDASHASLRDDFEVSSEALEVARAEARRHPGCLGARLVGAGFAGCVLALVRSGAEEEVASDVPVRLREHLAGAVAYPVRSTDGAGEAEVG